MVSCTPALHLFWSKNGDFLRNNYLLTLLTSHNKSATHQSNKNRSSSSEIDQIKIVQQHSQETQYLELEEGLESGSPLYEAWAHSSDRHASF